ncbi:hypothetical protein D1872_314610 [compost metagenome]
MDEYAVGTRFYYVFIEACRYFLANRISRNWHAPFRIDAALIEFIALVYDIARYISFDVQVRYVRRRLSGNPAYELTARLFDPIDPRDIHRLKFLT